MPDSGKVKARWAAGYPVELPDRTVLHPGDEYEVGRDEAEGSENWDVARVEKPSRDRTESPSADEPRVVS